MRILAVAPYFPPEGGGLERYAQGILSGLAERSHDVRVLALSRNASTADPSGALDVRRIAASGCLGNAPFNLSFASHVRNAVREFRPDIVVAHTPVPFAAEMAFLAVRGTGIPFVVTYHAGRLAGSSRALGIAAALHRHTMERWMLGQANHLIAVSPFVRDHALRQERHRVTVVPPGIDPARFGEPTTATGRGILFVGPLSQAYRWKGVDTLVRAFLRLRRDDPEVTLTLVGDGDRRADLARVARLAGVPLALPGRLSDAALVAEYRKAAVIALPSTDAAEAFGMVLAEANACSRPVVASRVGGIPDFVRHEANGLLARPGDEVDLAAKLADVLGHPGDAHRMGQAGRELVLRDHTWASLAIRTERALEHCIEARPAARRAAY